MILIASMWDDGLVTDLKLLDFFREKNIPACFAISPSRHKNYRVKNDFRGDYGLLVTKKELKEFSDFEICNHTNNHVDLKKINFKKTKMEIIDGKKNLEDIFGHSINGFCYPYGNYTNAALSVLSECNTLYARTTFSSFFPSQNKLILNPTFRWDKFDVFKIFQINTLILWGHTYEMKNLEDWNKIKKIYTLLIENPQVKFVTFEEMIKNYESFSRNSIQGSSTQFGLV